MPWLRVHMPGLLFALALAAVAYALGTLFPLIGGAVIGILGGIAVGSLVPLPQRTAPGLAFSAKKILQGAIIVLGSGLALGQVYATGMSSLVIILTTITAALCTAAAVGRLLKVRFNLISLIGVGTAICGGSAIAAVAPVIDAEEQEVAYAISTVFLFNVVAVLVFPPLGHLLGMTQPGFGMFAGTAINDTSSVVAAAYAYGNGAGDYATIVKLTRTIMIIPIAVAFVPIMMFRTSRTQSGGSAGGFNFVKVFPWFIVGFVAASALNTSGVLSANTVHVLRETGKFMIIMALTAIGLRTDLKKMLHTGFAPAFLGLAVWIVVSATSVIVQKLLGQW